MLWIFFSYDLLMSCPVFLAQYVLFMMLVSKSLGLSLGAKFYEASHG